MPTRLPVLLHSRKSAAAACPARSAGRARQAARAEQARSSRKSHSIRATVHRSLADFAQVSRPVDENGAEIIDIRKGGPGCERSPRRRKSRSNCCRRETRPDRGSARPRARSCGRHGAGGVVRQPRRRRCRRCRPRAQRCRASRRAQASASAYSWFGPPRPWPRMVTVSSPPDRITARRPAACRSRARRACRPPPRALRLRDGRRGTRVVAGGARPGLGGAERIGRARDDGTRVPANAGSPGFGRFVAGIVERARHGPAGRAGSARRSRAHRRASSGSGTVGPEPITAGSSPGTSEIASVTTRAG